MEFVKKIPSIQNVLAYLTLQSAAWQKHCKFLCKLFSYSCSICHAVVFCQQMSGPGSAVELQSSGE